MCPLISFQQKSETDTAITGLYTKISGLSCHFSNVFFLMVFIQIYVMTAFYVLNELHEVVLKIAISCLLAFFPGNQPTL